MPPTPEHESEPIEGKSLQEVVAELGLYPVEAFQFVQQGLSQTITLLHGEMHGEMSHGELKDGETAEAALSEEEQISRHISGQQLAEGLRLYALEQWGLLASTVLRRWNITSTVDFGRIVFAMVDAKMMKKTDEDTLDDFRDVFDFKTAFENAYQIGTCS